MHIYHTKTHHRLCYSNLQNHHQIWKLHTPQLCIYGIEVLSKFLIVYFVISRGCKFSQLYDIWNMSYILVSDSVKNPIIICIDYCQTNGYISVQSYVMLNQLKKITHSALASCLHHCMAKWVERVRVTACSHLRPGCLPRQYNFKLFKFIASGCKWWNLTYRQ